MNDTCLGECMICGVENDLVLGVCQECVCDEMAESLKLCIEEALKNREFIEQYDRLNNTNIGGRGREPIEQMIDKHTSKQKSDAYQFFDFVRDYVWLPSLCGGDSL